MNSFSSLPSGLSGVRSELQTLTAGLRAVLISALVWAVCGGSVFGAQFTSGNIAVMQLAAASNNTTGAIIELSPSTANQASPVQTINITALRCSDSGTSSFLSLSNDRKLLVFGAYNTTDATDADLATVTALDPATDRAVGTFDNGTNFVLQTTYTGLTGNQIRSATSLDDGIFFISDKGGLYTNAATSASLATNLLVAKSFGGTVYIASTSAALPVSTVTGPTATSLTGLPGLAADTKIQDFYLIQSGAALNGNTATTYDVLYFVDSNATNNVLKYSLVNGTWTANGSATFASLGLALIAANNGGGGASVYITTKPTPVTGNALVQLTDSAGYNATINISSTVTLFTTTASTTLKGMDFVPAASTAPTVASPTKTAIGINVATLGGTVSTTGGQSLTERGVVYSLTATNNNPKIGGTGVNKMAEGQTLTGVFTTNVTGLVGNSAYSYAAYATNSIGTTYTSVDTFSTTSANPPTIDTPTDTAITTTTATLGATVESNGGASITKTGVVYAPTATNNNPTIGGTGVVEVDTGSPVASGAFTVPVTGLTANTAYTFAGFATNSSGTTYTAKTAFSTLAAPTVDTPVAFGITTISATLGGTIESNGGASTTESGVVYALTSANGNPQLGGTGVTKVDTGSPVNSGPFSVSVSGLTAGTSYTFAAFATNSVGTTYTPATSFTASTAGIIASWTFPAVVASPYNSPAPTYGNGTATTLGMTNAYNGGNTANDDVLSTSGTLDPNFTENTWRIRGTAHNGWATFQSGAGAPQYSQGLELDVNTTGFSNIVFSFDWYSTTQGIRDLQVQYNTGSGWVNYQGPSATGTYIAASNDYFNATLSPANPTIHIALPAAANNNANVGVRLVSAFDSTGTLGTEYASAASTPGAVVAYNNSSGNWRFANMTFASGILTSTAVSASPAGSQSVGKNVTLTATITPASGAQFPTGTVTFFDGGTQLGATQTVTQVGATKVGTASVITAALIPGIHNAITAQYTPAAGNNFIASGSSMSQVVGAPTNNPISYTIVGPAVTGLDIAPLVGRAFSGAVATFSEGADVNPADFSATIDWGDGQTTNGVVAFSSTISETNINGVVAPVNILTVNGTHTYATVAVYTMTVIVTDNTANSSIVTPVARVTNLPTVVTGVAPVTNNGTNFVNKIVATFTAPGLVANIGGLGIVDPTTQFTTSINWGDNTAATAGTVSYNSGSQVFSIAGSHNYAATGSYNVSVTVTPLTLSVERIVSSDPHNYNLVGDENGNGLTDASSADFIDQFAIGGSNQSTPLYTLSLPAISTTSGNRACTNSSYSVSEGQMTLSTNGQYLVLGGYNMSVNAWGPQQTFSPASVINRVIARINGAGVIDTTTALTDLYSGDNFRGVVSTDGTQFWTSGNATDSSNFVHSVQYGATSTTVITGPAAPSNINTVEIFNGQLYQGVRSVASGAPAGIYQIGMGLPTTSGQTQTLFIQVPQANPLDVGATGKPMSPFGFYLTNLSNGNPLVNGVNVCYIADAEMGIMRYDNTNSGWKFSYYINSTGSFLNNAFTVDASGNVSATGNFNPNNPAASADPAKAGGVRELTGRVVNGQVQIFAVTGFSIGAQPFPGGKVIQVNDTGAGSSFTVIATNPGISELTSIAFTPSQTVVSPLLVQPSEPVFNAVAAGDVTSNDVILWTRCVNPSAPAAVAVTVQVATDVNFNNITTTLSGNTDPNQDYTVKLNVVGLSAGNRYYYRFLGPNGIISNFGTFKTAYPASMKAPVHFAFSGDCDGRWRPFPSVVDIGSQSLDFFEFCGDTTYENASSPAFGIVPASPAVPAPEVNAAATLTALRRKYLENISPVTTNGNASLKNFFAAQANYTLLDNHELCSNVGKAAYQCGGAPNPGAGAVNYTPSNSANDINLGATKSAYTNSTAEFAACVQAFRNYEPFRETIISAPADPRTDQTYQLYNSYQWGKNLIFIHTDDRSYADQRESTAGSPRSDNAQRTRLGTTQLAWLEAQLLAAQQAGTPWKIVTVSDPFDNIGPLNGTSLSGPNANLTLSDGSKSWMGGYRWERNLLLKFIADNNIQNVVFLATDDHTNRVNELQYSPIQDAAHISDITQYVLVPGNCFSIIAGPIGASGPELFTDHTYATLLGMANGLANAQKAARINPVGLDPAYIGLHDVFRENDASADATRGSIDFFSADTENYQTLDISADGKTLTMSTFGINSYNPNLFLEPSATGPVRKILNFSVDAYVNPVSITTAAAGGAATVPIPLTVSPVLATGANTIQGTLQIVASGIPADATLSAGTLNVNTGNYTLTAAQLLGLKITVPTAGSYTLTFTANDLDTGNYVEASASATLALTVVAIQPPVASNGSIIATGTAKATGTLVAVDPNGLPLTYAIVTNGTKGVATITNAATGVFSYTANANAFASDSFTFTASDSSGVSNVATISVVIQPTGGNAASTAIIAPLSGGPYVAPATIVFDGSASNPNIVAYQWDFGDGNQGTGATPSHTFANAGTYTVSLTVINGAGVTSTPATVTVVVAANVSNITLSGKFNAKGILMANYSVTLPKSVTIGSTITLAFGGLTSTFPLKNGKGHSKQGTVAVSGQTVTFKLKSTATTLFGSIPAVGTTKTVTVTINGITFSEVVTFTADNKNTTFK